MLLIIIILVITVPAISQDVDYPIESLIKRELYDLFINDPIYRERQLDQTCLINAAKFGTQICLVKDEDPETKLRWTCQLELDLMKSIVSKKMR